MMLPGFALCGMLVHFSNANLEEVHASFRTDEIEAAKESIALSLMGQLQFTAQSLIWMKTLEYMHNGVAYRMPTSAEEERGFRAAPAVGVAAGLEHAEGVPLALNEQLDWRGPVGTLHRTVMPQMVEHSHSDPVELIPWYELALKLNPNLERLYTLGAFFMADFAQEPDEALGLLEAGVQANPWSFEVRAALGRLLFDHHQQLGIDPTEAYERAASVLREAVELAKAEEERLGMNEDHFDEYQQQLLRESYVFLAKSLAELGRYDEALKVCDEGYELTKHNHLRIQKRIIVKEMESGSEKRSQRLDQAQ
jgi:tetratricopeptide (TPR) repeat protein